MFLKESFSWTYIFIIWSFGFQGNRRSSMVPLGYIGVHYDLKSLGYLDMPWCNGSYSVRASQLLNPRDNQMMT